MAVRQVSTLLIDNNGRAWDAGSWTLRRRFYANRSAIGFADFLVRNLGYISLSFYDDSCALRASPARTALPALATAGRLMADAAPTRVTLSWFDGQWNYELLRGREPAMTRLLTLHGTLAKSDGKRYLDCQRNLTDLPTHHPLGMVLDLWRDSCGSIHLTQHKDALDSCLQAKFAMVRCERDTARLIFSHVGRGIVMYDQAWHEIAEGLRVEDQPDHTYAKWVAGRYREAILSNEPLLSDVDALVWTPLDGLQRITYSRLTLPVMTKHGRPSLLSATHLDAAIDLRFEIHHKAE